MGDAIFITLGLFLLLAFIYEYWAENTTRWTISIGDFIETLVPTSWVLFCGSIVSFFIAIN